jgi:hypothetical protein
MGIIVWLEDKIVKLDGGILKMEGIIKNGNGSKSGGVFGGKTIADILRECVFHSTNGR